MAQNNFSGKLGYKGFPALFFIETMHSLRGDKKLIEKVESIAERFDYLFAYLPVKFEKSEKTKAEYKDKILPLINEAAAAVQAMMEEYQDVYDTDGAVVSQGEKDFLHVMRAAKQRVYRLAAESGMIDDMQMAEEEMIF